MLAHASSREVTERSQFTSAGELTAAEPLEGPDEVSAAFGVLADARAEADGDVDRGHVEPVGGVVDVAGDGPVPGGDLGAGRGGGREVGLGLQVQAEVCARGAVVEVAGELDEAAAPVGGRVARPRRRRPGSRSRCGCVARNAALRAGVVAPARSRPRSAPGAGLDGGLVGRSGPKIACRSSSVTTSRPFQSPASGSRSAAGRSPVSNDGGPAASVRGGRARQLERRRFPLVDADGVAAVAVPVADDRQLAAAPTVPKPTGGRSRADLVAQPEDAVGAR